jgi:hypothetical protein
MSTQSLSHEVTDSENSIGTLVGKLFVLSAHNASLHKTIGPILGALCVEEKASATKSVYAMTESCSPLRERILYMWENLQPAESQMLRETIEDHPQAFSSQFFQDMTILYLCSRIAILVILLLQVH